MGRTKAMVLTMVVEVVMVKDTGPDKGMATGSVRVGAAVAAVASESLEAHRDARPQLPRKGASGNLTLFGRPQERSRGGEETCANGLVDALTVTASVAPGA